MHIVESHPRILVVGDMMLDHYLWGHCERISPEAPVQIVDVKEESTVLGGAGNVVHNLVALGATVSVASV
ncbi:MAG: bifunctional heptose 7-phosphate kinase/heptose 1-phosphate adenyltransferase, partial [Sulfuricurvum sp.]|nr:bifunctional heptose 7-phosphate kinase/heptose 1-phosphate adenyltransferase [Sulfuricurvum sp.]